MRLSVVLLSDNHGNVGVFDATLVLRGAAMNYCKLAFFGSNTYRARYINKWLFKSCGDWPQSYYFKVAPTTHARNKPLHDVALLDDLPAARSY